MNLLIATLIVLVMAYVSRVSYVVYKFKDEGILGYQELHEWTEATHEPNLELQDGALEKYRISEEQIFNYYCSGFNYFSLHWNWDYIDIVRKDFETKFYNHFSNKYSKIIGMYIGKLIDKVYNTCIQATDLVACRILIKWFGPEITLEEYREIKQEEINRRYADEDFPKIETDYLKRGYEVYDPRLDLL